MQNDQIARFRDKYIIKLIHYNVPDKSRRWYVKQATEALQILFIDMIDAPWADKFPWHHYAEAATPLPENHATIARDIRTVQELLGHANHVKMK